ncbi:MAG: T9SS type A sorting domain-containing protein [bacterium]|nr:T9SS type A sorting domain-containing protein [bacterium]
MKLQNYKSKTLRSAFHSKSLFLIGIGIALSFVSESLAKPPRVPVYESAVPTVYQNSSWVNPTTGLMLFTTLTEELPTIPPIKREEYIRDYLGQNYGKWGLSSLPEIQLILRQNTPGGEVLRFYQTTAGVVSQENDLVAQFNPNGQLHSLHQSLHAKLSLKSGIPLISEQNAITIAQTAMQTSGENYPPVVKMQAWLSPTETSHLIYRVTLTPTTPNGEWEALIDASSGEVLRTQETSRYIDGSGYTFDPDPLTTGQATYGSTGYVDGNDADTQQLTAQRRLRVLREITLNSGTYRLTGPWVSITNFEAPNTAPVTATHPDSFRYTRSPSGFEDVHVYAHIDSAQRWIQYLGFNNIQHTSMQIDPHGLNGDDNSYFLPSSNRIAYGEGGVDDAEDVDVVWHEYGHSIQYSQVSNWGGGEAGSLGEGFGDYWAGSYSASISSFRREWVYNWDGHNTYWDGRVLNSTMVYPANMGGSIHENGQIWSRALMDIWDSCGREVTDKIVLQGQFAVGYGVTYPTLANAILNADLTLYQGVHISAAYNCFHARGILSQMPNIASVVGAVTSQVTGAIAGVVVNLNGSPRDTTDSQGRYSIAGLSFSQYQISFNHPSYNLYSTTFTVSQPGATTINAVLNRPIYSVDHDSLFIQIGESDTTLVRSPAFTITNTGDGNGSYSFQAFSGTGGSSNSWVYTRELDVGTITGDTRLHGVEIVGNEIILSGSNNTSEPNYFYRVSRSGSLLGSIQQRSVTTNGVRDLAASGGYLFGGENDTIWRWNADLSGEQFVCRTILNPPRGIAVQRNANNEPVIWICDNTQPARKFAADGSLLSSATNTYYISGVAAMPNEGGKVWFVSCDNSYSQLWINTLNEAGTAVVRLTQLDLPVGYRSAGACYTLDEWGDLGQIAILFTSSSPSRAILRFYNIPTDVNYVSITSSRSGTLAPTASIPVNLSLRLDPNRQRFTFNIQQTNSPAASLLTTVVIQRATEASEHSAVLPEIFDVSPVYPNPFNHTAKVMVSMPEAGYLQLSLYNLLGQSVLNRNTHLPAGVQLLQVDLSDFPTGTYFSKITYRNNVTTQRWVLLK